MPRYLPLLSLLLLGSLLAGCGQVAPQSAAELNRSYLLALEQPAADFSPGGSSEQAALARLADYFASMTAESVAAQTASVYAPAGYLNDNLAAVSGAAAIEAYFSHAVAQVSALEVEFLDVARSGPDYFIRWEMRITAPRLNDGAAMVSYGVSHFRFDAEGRVLVHKDFWDAGTGLYEYLPGVGGLVRRIRGAAGPD